MGKYPPPVSFPSSPPTSTLCKYRTFGQWTLNSFLVCELGECKHDQRGHKNKSVIARDSLCQHLSWGAPQGEKGAQFSLFTDKGRGLYKSGI